MRKKLLTTLALLIPQLGGFVLAQPTVTNQDVTAIETGKYYYLYNNGRGGYINIGYTFTDGQKSNVLLSNAISASNWVNYIVRFEADGENYKVKLFDDSYLLNAESSANVSTTTDAEEAISISATYDATNKWALKNLTNNLYFNGNAASFCYWGGTQDTNNGKYFIREVSVTDAEFAEAKAAATPQDYFSTSFADAKWFNMYIREAGNFVSYSAETEPYGVTKNATEAQRTSDAYQWALIKNADGTVKMINKAAGSGKTLTRNGNNAVLRDGDYSWDIFDNLGGFVLRVTGTDNQYINQNGGTNGTFQFWDNGGARTDAGSTMWFVSVPEVQVVNVTYRVSYNGSVVSETQVLSEPGLPIEIPSELQRSYVTLDYNANQTAFEGLIVDITATWNGPFEISSDIASAHWYNITVRNENTFVGYDTTSNPNVKTSGSNSGTDAQKWAFLGDPVAGFTLVNKANTALTLGYQDNPEGMNLTEGNTVKWIAQASADRTNGFYLANSQTGSRPNHRTATGLLLNWGGADAGSTFVVEEVKADFSAEVNANIVPFVETAGRYFSVADATLGGLWNESYKTACDEATYATLNAYVTDNANIKQPETGYYRIKNNYEYSSRAGLGYIAANAAGTTTVSKSDLASVVKLTKVGDLTYTISSQGENLVDNGALDFSDGEGSQFVFAIKTPGVVSMSAGEDGQSIHWQEAGNKLVYWNSGADASHWTVEDAASVELTVSEAGYATLNVPFGLSLGGDVKAYTGKVNGDALVLTEVQYGDLPANTPVVIEAEAGTYEVKINDSEATVGENDLQGTLIEAAVDGALTLQVIDDEVGFYSFNGTAIGANKAYILLPEGDVKGLSIQFGDATGIHEMVNGESSEMVNGKSLNGKSLNGKWYGLAGQRVSRVRKGVLIQQGKKLIIK